MQINILYLEYYVKNERLFIVNRINKPEALSIAKIYRYLAV